MTAAQNRRAFATALAQQVEAGTLSPSDALSRFSASITKRSRKHVAPKGRKESPMSKSTASKVIPLANPFTASGATLKAAAASGNEAAIAEVARRQANKAAKRA